MLKDHFLNSVIMFYLIVCAVIFFFSFIRFGKYKRITYWILLAFLTIFSGFRFQIGCDWFAYEDFFRRIPDFSFQEILLQRDAGFYLINRFIYNLELDFIYVNIFTSIIFFIGLHSLAKRQPEPISFLALAFPILIVNMPMSALRQGIAIGLVCIAFLAILDKKFIKFVALIVLASLFHSSALIFLLLTPFVKQKYSNKNLILSGFLFLPGAYLLTFTSLDDIVIQRYIQTDMEAYGAFFRVGFLFITAIFFQFFLRKKWQFNFPEDYTLVQVGSIMIMLLIPLTFVSSVIGDRVGYYFIPIQLIILARLHHFYDGRNRIYIKYAPFAALGFIFIVWTSFSYHFNLCYLPYRSWLFL